MAFGLKYDNVDRYIKSYAKYILRQARYRLEKKDVTGALSNSLDYEIIKTKKGWTIEFTGADYADYVAKGVSGTEGTRTYIDIEGSRKRSPYSYGDKMPPTNSIFNWVKDRGIKGRDKETGRFITDKSLSFAISKGIQKKGVPAASFFTQPISWSFNIFKNEIQKQVKIDLLKYITDK